MPPFHSHPSLHLQVLPDPFFVVQLHKGDGIPPCVLKHLIDDTGKFLSLTRTRDEVSLVGESQPGMPDYLKTNSGWRCIKIAGPMDFSLTGILSDFTAPLKEAKVPVFAISTWNTDYVLVPTEMLTNAVNTLEKDGWVFLQRDGGLVSVPGL